MPNINTAQFSLPGMGTKRSLGERLNERWLSVKDFGATGNGSTNDADAIQDAFDYNFGTVGSPNGSNSDESKIIFLPAGNYKISQPLVLPNAYGVTLIGAGSHQTRLFWSGPEVEGEEDYQDGSPVTDPVSSLIEARTCWHVHMEGLTLDAGGVQDVAYRLMRTSSGPGVNSSGSDGYYRDVHFTNAVSNGVWAGGDTHASEQLYVDCSFTDCKWGLRLSQRNALNHSCVGCNFSDNEIGYSQILGGAGTFLACQFHNNSLLDVHAAELSLRVDGCFSTSQNFVIGDGYIVGCRHVHGSEGIFWSPAWTSPSDGTFYTSTATVACTGNYSANGKFHSENSSGRAILKGNVFDNPDYVSDFLTVGAAVWEDGAEL